MPEASPRRRRSRSPAIPRRADFVRQEVVAAVVRAAQARPGAQVVVSADDVPFSGTLAQDRVAVVDVPVLVQGSDYIEVDATTRVDVRNVAAPRISPDSLMVSDYPERLEENGTLFTADLRSEQPSRFLYFHYNPPGQPPRRVVLRVDNTSPEPANVQFISGRGGPTANEMEAGHTATRRLLDQRRAESRAADHDPRKLVAEHRRAEILPPGTIVCNLLQLRVLSGNGSVHLTLTSQHAPTVTRRRSRRSVARSGAQARARHLSDPGVLLRGTVERQRRLPRGSHRSDSAAQRSPRPSVGGRLRRAAIVRGDRAQPGLDAAGDRHLRKPARRTRDRNLLSSTASWCSRIR